MKQRKTHDVEMLIYTHVPMYTLMKMIIIKQIQLILNVYVQNVCVIKQQTFNTTCRHTHTYTPIDVRLTILLKYLNTTNKNKNLIYKMPNFERSTQLDIGVFNVYIRFGPIGEDGAEYAGTGSNSCSC